MRCGECGWDPQDSGARFCGHCGAVLATSVEPDDGHPDRRDGADGGPFPVAPPGRQEQPPARRPRARWIALAAVGVLVAASAALLDLAGGEVEDRDRPVSMVAPPEPVESVRHEPGYCSRGEQGCVRWRLTGEDAVFRGPAVFGEFGYVGVTDGERSAVVAFELLTGRRSWLAETIGDIRLSPATGDGIVVVVIDRGGSSVVEAFGVLSGERRWHTDLGFRAEGPLAVNDDVVFVGGSDVAVGLDARTGRKVTGFAVDGVVTPVVLEHDGYVYYGHDGGIEAVDVRRELPLWSADGDRVHVAPKAARYGVGRLVIVAHDDGAIAAYRGRSGEELWRRDDLTLPGLPPLAEHLLVVGVRDGRFVQLKPWSGDPLRAPGEDALPLAAEPSPLGTPSSWVLAGRTAYVVDDTEVAAYDVRSGGAALWSYDFGEGEGSPGTPVISLDSVLVTAANELVALKR